MNIIRGIQLGLLFCALFLVYNFSFSFSTLLEARKTKSSFNAILGMIDAYREDSAAGKPGQMYASIHNTYVEYTRAGTFAINSNGEKVPVICNSRHVTVDVPIDEKGLDGIIFSYSALMVISVAIFIWICYSAFRFSQAADRGDFFQWKNFRRVQRIGIVIISYGILDYLVRINMDDVAEWLLGYSGLLPGLKNDIALLPLWFLTGAVLIVIAQAFKKGIDLQRKENAAI